MLSPNVAATGYFSGDRYVLQWVLGSAEGIAAMNERPPPFSGRGRSIRIWDRIRSWLHRIVRRSETVPIKISGAIAPDNRLADAMPADSLPTDPSVSKQPDYLIVGNRPWPAHLMPNSSRGLKLLETYLQNQGNDSAIIVRLGQLLSMNQVVLEIGCGSGEVAFEIALKNPDTGVIATDQYDWTIAAPSSQYGKVALAWHDRKLPAQQNMPPNLVLLRAEAEVLLYLPDQVIDSILLINPEPAVGKAFLNYLHQNHLHHKIKPGASQIIILPYSRELGVMTCGGYEFDHSEDWSKGLGFLMESPFTFRKSPNVHWGVDLRQSSPYSKRSTQCDVYVYGNRPPMAPALIQFPSSDGFPQKTS